METRPVAFGTEPGAGTGWEHEQELVMWLRTLWRPPRTPSRLPPSMREGASAEATAETLPAGGQPYTGSLPSTYRRALGFLSVAPPCGGSVGVRQKVHPWGAFGPPTNFRAG
jgi:hypothetical protein